MAMWGGNTKKWGKLAKSNNTKLLRTHMYRLQILFWW